MKDLVAIDSSAWIAFLRDAKDLRPTVELVEKLVSERHAAVVAPVVLELMHGARSEDELGELQTLFEPLPRLEVTWEDWMAAAKLLQKLAQEGKIKGRFDALIAAVAKRHAVPVLTHDRDFELLGVELYSLPLSSSGEPAASE